MPKAYSYIRMSTPEQLKGDSVRRQLKATEAYVTENGLELTDIIHDHGVSAFKGKNAEFGALSAFLHLAEAGEIEPGSFLVVESLDRLTRQNVFDAISLLNRIIGNDIHVVTLIDRRVYSRASLERSEMDLMIAAITMMRAHEESRTKSVRLSSAWEQKRHIARSGGVTKQRIPGWLRFSADGLAIEPIPERTEVLREIFELSRGGWGAYSIARRLNDQRCAPWGNAKFWQESYIKKLLSNRAVLGEYQPRTLVSDKTRKIRANCGEPIPDYYPPVIDELVFSEATQAAALRRTTGRGRKGSQHPNLFSGLLKCGYCEGGIRYMDKGAPPKGGRYLRCSDAVLTRKCSAPALRYEYVERHLLTVIQNIDFQKVLKGEEWDQTVRTMRRRRLDVSNEIVATTGRIERIVDAIAEVPDSDDLLLKLRELNAVRGRSEEQLAVIDAELAELAGSNLSGADFMDELLVGLADGTDTIDARKRTAAELARVIKAIYISPQTVEPNEVNDFPGLNASQLLEVRIRYRNGALQFTDPLRGYDMQVEDGEKQRLMRQRHLIETMDR